MTAWIVRERDCRVAALLTRKSCHRQDQKTAEILTFSSRAGRPTAGTELAMTVRACAPGSVPRPVVRCRTATSVHQQGAPVRHHVNIVLVAGTRRHQDDTLIRTRPG